ncbi:hypothetical protein Sros01_01070 [Streptomyces roseochromogenus]|nr:hypothetical protein Sros01_01070 [Streptomyces roseochromogenus]
MEHEPGRHQISHGRRTITRGARRAREPSGRDGGNTPERAPGDGPSGPADRAGRAGGQCPKSNQLTFTKSADWPLVKVR